MHMFNSCVQSKQRRLKPSRRNKRQCPIIHWGRLMYKNKIIMSSYSSKDQQPKPVSPLSSSRYDYVEVYNGGDELSPMLGKFCGKIAPSPIISSGSQLLIKFVSDYETHGAGFSVRYEVFKTGALVVCGFIIQLAEMSLL